MIYGFCVIDSYWRSVKIMPYGVAYLLGGVRGLASLPHNVAMSTDLERAAKAFRRAEAALEARRAELAAAVVAADEAGTRQSEIVRVTGYTRETVRRLVRDAAH